MKKRQYLLDVIKHYQSTFKAFGPTAQGANWKNQSSQYLRFKIIIDLIGKKEINNKIITDLGCGAGAFFDYCLSEDLSIKKFIGYDIVEEVLNFCQVKYKFASIDNLWIHSDKLLQKTDYAISSGIFNVKLKYTDLEWEDYILNILDNMNDKSDFGFCFNLLTNKVDWKAQNLFYADPYKFVSYCQKYDPIDIKLIENYGLYEWTILVKKKTKYEIL